MNEREVDSKSFRHAAGSATAEPSGAPLAKNIAKPKKRRNDQLSPEERLPPRDTQRWVTRRKAEVVNAVHNGVITLDDACERYNLSQEEFLSWESLVKKHGLRGLRVTQAHRYR